MNLDFPVGTFWAVPLATVRIFSLMMTGPVFSHKSVPVRVRVAIGFLTALVLAPAVPGVETFGASTLSIAGAIAIEALIGVTMGFSLQLIFMAFAPLGEFLSVQGGLAAANIIDPGSGSSTVVLGVLLQSFALVVFLAVGGHHEVLRGLAASFERMPIGASALSGELFGSVSALGGALFEVTVRLAAPVTVVMLVANVGIGILGRAIPQLNLIAVQLPANVAVVLLILALAAGPFSDAVGRILSAFTERALSTLLRFG